MLAISAWIIFLVGLTSLAFYQVAAKKSLVATLILLVILTSFAPSWFLVFFWVIWLVCVSGRFFPEWRQRFFTRSMMRWARRMLPPISQHEREVVESGGLWWETELFSGNPNWQKLFKTEADQLSPEEQAFLAGPVNEFCALINSWQVKQQNNLPKAAWEFIKSNKLWGLVIPKEFGGFGFSAAAHSAIITKIATHSMDAAITIMVPNALGPACFIEYFGTEEQKHYYLPRLASGEDVGCFALTSPVAGSDAASIIDRGVVCRDSFEGKETLGIRLTFCKRYITLAPVTTLIGLAFQLSDPDHLLSDVVERGITCALVPAHLPGVSFGERHKPMNLAFMNGPVRGKEVFIPMELIVGGIQNVGKGWFMLMECLAVGRGISLPGLASAANQYCLLVTSAYAKLRWQFKRPIGDFEGVAAGIATIAGYNYLAEATRVFTAKAVDAGCKPSIASAIAKYHLTELARKSVNHAMDIHGGKALQDGPRNYLATLYNAIPISVTVEGANILTRNLIIFGQGLLRCHPFLFQEMELLQSNAAEAEQKFDLLLLKHIGFTLSALAKTLAYGLTGGHLIGTCRAGVLKKPLQQLTRMSSAFAFLIDISLLLIGSKLKFKESLSARFGDIVSHFYLASSVLRYYEQQSEPAEQEVFVRWAIAYCLQQIGQSFSGILQNYPQKWIGKLLWRLIFPYGNVYLAPKDEWSFEIAGLMQNNKALREKLTALCYIGKGHEAVVELETVFQQSASAEQFFATLPGKGMQPDPILLAMLEKLREDNKISEEDSIRLEKFLVARQNVLKVDEFAAIDS